MTTTINEEYLSKSLTSAVTDDCTSELTSYPDLEPLSINTTTSWESKDNLYS